MVNIKHCASNTGARCRSPSRLRSSRRIRSRTISAIKRSLNGSEINKVEATSRACGSSATKFHTGNNRERRRMNSAL